MYLIRSTITGGECFSPSSMTSVTFVTSESGESNYFLNTDRSLYLCCEYYFRFVFNKEHHSLAFGLDKVKVMASEVGLSMVKTLYLKQKICTENCSMMSFIIWYANIIINFGVDISWNCFLVRSYDQIIIIRIIKLFIVSGSSSRWSTWIILKYLIWKRNLSPYSKILFGVSYQQAEWYRESDIFSAGQNVTVSAEIVYQINVTWSAPDVWYPGYSSQMTNM